MQINNSPWAGQGILPQRPAADPAVKGTEVASTPAALETQTAVLGKSATSQSENQSLNQKSPEDRKKEIEESVKKLNETVKLYNSDLSFSIDDETNMQIIKVTDRTTKDVIRQIPTMEVVRIAKAIDEFKSLFIEEKV